MKDLYKQAILEAVDSCTDTNLLDLVWKMLVNGAETPSPTPSNVIGLEVKRDADHSRDTQKHGTVTVQICGRAAHPRPIHSKMGNRREQLPELCGGADSLSRAA